MELASPPCHRIGTKRHQAAARARCCAAARWSLHPGIQPHTPGPPPSPPAGSGCARAPCLACGTPPAHTQTRCAGSPRCPPPSAQEPARQAGAGAARRPGEQARGPTATAATPRGSSPGCAGRPRCSREPVASGEAAARRGCRTLMGGPAAGVGCGLRTQNAWSFTTLCPIPRDTVTRSRYRTCACGAGQGNDRRWGTRQLQPVRLVCAAEGQHAAACHAAHSSCLLQRSPRAQHRGAGAARYLRPAVRFVLHLHAPKLKRQRRLGGEVAGGRQVTHCRQQAPATNMASPPHTANLGTSRSALGAAASQPARQLLLRRAHSCCRHPGAAARCACPTVVGRWGGGTHPGTGTGAGGPAPRPAPPPPAAARVCLGGRLACPGWGSP